MLVELRMRLESELERLAQEVVRGARATMDDEPAGSEPGSAHHAIRDPRARVRQFGQLLAALPKVDPASITAENVGFGSIVTLLDLDLGVELTYTISAGEFIDLDAGEVSLDSPIGHSLIGKSEGDEIGVVTPRGQKRFRILRVTTLPQRLGLEPAASMAV